MALWFCGSTMIGIPIVFGIVGFRGFCLGYTISSTLAVLGTAKGILFCLTGVLLQTVLFLPCLFALAVSGIQFYRTIMKEKKKENVKQEFYRHTLFCLILTVGLILSSFVEVYVSTNLLSLCGNYL